MSRAQIVAIPAAQLDRLTEAGAAERFARLHGADARFNHSRGRWLLWRGHRWAPDTDEQIMRRGLTFALAWQRDALDIQELELRKQTIGAALKLERRQALASMLKLAAALEPITDDGEHWDSDPWLLGVPNGVVDLRTGQLRAGQREDRLTMNTAVAYDPNARCDRWEAFLAEVFDAPDLIAFLRRAIGYSLTGDTGQQCLFLCYGTGANGKGTLTQTLAHVLGDYAYAMPFATIELHQRSAIPNDLAALVGRRFISASETNDGTRLNESRVKALTGCDPITARFLHAEFFTFQLVGKFWLAVNHRPVVRDDSSAFWRRIRLIPFTRTFGVNPRLAGELRDEAPGILAWAVQGCRAWQKDGLNPPAIVIDATRDYERESDPLADFIEEAIEREPESEVRASELFDHYQRWAKNRGMSDRESLSRTAFGRKMSERFASRRINGTKRYLGIALRAL